MTPECLICLGPMRNQWTPNTKCDCNPILHKKCWQKWIERGNGACIICRPEPEPQQEPQPQEPEQQQQQQPEPAGFWHDYKAIYIFNMVLYILFVCATIYVIRDHVELSQKDEL